MADFPFADPGDPLGGGPEPYDPTPMPAEFLAGIVNAGGRGPPVDDHDANLAEHIDASELRSCANKLIEDIKRDRQSREPLDKLLDEGLKKLGFDRTDDTRSDYFEGASNVMHPLMAHSIVDFQARAIKEIFPAKGPVRTEIMGERTRLDAQTLAKAERVRRYMNWQVTRKCREWRGSVDEMLMHLPLAGTAISKITWDQTLRRPRRENVPIGYFHCPLGVDSLERAPRYTHEMRLWPEEVRANQEAGFWRDVALPAPYEDQPKEVEQRAMRILGEERAASSEDDRHTILEIHVDYHFRSLEEPAPAFAAPAGGAVAGLASSLSGDGMIEIDLEEEGYPSFEGENLNMGSNGSGDEYNQDYSEASGSVHYPKDLARQDDYARMCPYIITVEEETATVLAVRRNWKRGDDELKQKRVWFQIRRMFPWKGIWGLGLLHLLGGLSTAATGALRALMDSAMIHNMPMGLRLRASKATAQRVRLAPLTLAEVDAPGATDIREVAMPLPFNGPSPVLFELMKEIVTIGRQFATVATQELVESGPNLPVGTTLALIEQGSMVYSAIHARLHYAQGEELEVLHDLNGEYLEDEETFRDFAGEVIAYRDDFDGGIDIIPVSDPNIFSQVQRAQQAEAKLDLAGKAVMAGVKVDMRAAFIDVARTLGLPGIEETFPEPEQAVPLDPVGEFAALLEGKPVQAFPGQNHLAHLTALRAAVADPQYALMLQRPEMAPRVLALAASHAALQRREEIEQMLGRPLPAMGEQVDPREAYEMAAAQAMVADAITRARPPLEGYDEQAGQDAAAMLLAQAEMVKAENEKLKIASDEKIAVLQAAAKTETIDAQTAADLTKLAAQIEAEKQQSAIKLSAELAEIEAKTKATLVIAREGRASQERIASGNIAAKIATTKLANEGKVAAAKAKPKPKPAGRKAA